MKRENRKIKKTNLKEITGARTELKEFLGEVLECECFVTNSVGFLGEKRLLTEVRIPQTNYYIKHLWVKEYNFPLSKVPHGYQKVELEVIKYTDKITQATKYGVKIPAKNKRKPAKIVKPKWKDEFIENEKLKNNSDLI